MNALWNKKNLEHPANNIWVASRKSVDLKKFVSALESIIKDLDSQSVLHMEAAILSRLIYRMKSKFRSDKGLKNMEKVNRALLNYLEVQLHKEYNDLKNYVEPAGRVVNLPTKQMLQYVLVRTQGFAKLMCRIENVAKLAAEFLKIRISIGHSWTVSVIAYAVISRVWYLSRYLLKRCCVWYNSIFEHVDKFKLIGPVWLPEDYKLPKNLKTWLNVPWIDQVTDSVPLKNDGKETIFGLIRGQIDDPSDLNFENEDTEDVLKRGNDSIVEKEIEVLNNGYESSAIKNEVFVFEDDIGMSIDREAFQLELSKEEPKIQEPIKKKKNLKRKKSKAINPEAIAAQNESAVSNKPKVSTVKDIGSPIPVKRKKKLLSVDEESEINLGNGKKAENRTGLSEERKGGKLKLLKSKKTVGKKSKQLTPGDIKTRGDLTTFLSQDSYPGLDRLQWNMMTNSIKKFVTKLEQCAPSEEKRQIILLKKVKLQIKNWIQ